MSTSEYLSNKWFYTYNGVGQASSSREVTSLLGVYVLHFLLK